MAQSAATSEVDLWTVSLLHPGPVYLSDDEVTRANRFRFERDRVRWSCARSLLRLILSRYADCEPGDLFFEYGEHGKPAIPAHPALEFNLSHSGDWAMIAVAHRVTVGVDLELIRPEVEIALLLERLGETDLPVGAAPPELYHLWTRREAKTKAVGGALFNKTPDHICVADVAAPEGYAASVALAGAMPVVQHRSLFG